MLPQNLLLDFMDALCGDGPGETYGGAEGPDPPAHSPPADDAAATASPGSASAGSDASSEASGGGGGTPLQLLPVPRGLAGRPYRELFDWALSRGALPLALYRSKPENPAWRLHYVATNPAWEDKLVADDGVIVLAQQGGA
jgi:hypothetical protein